MLRKFVSLALIGVLANLFRVPAQAQEQPWVQTIKEMKQVVQKALDKEKSVRVKLKKRQSGKTTLTGRVSEVSEAGFTLTDEKTNTTSTLTYDELKEVKVTGLSTGSKIAIGVVLASAVIVLAVIYKIASSD
jgi:hypothetical protein